MKMQVRKLTTMPKRPQFPLQVYYDGSCSVCAVEIEHYLRKDRSKNLVAVDISSPQFDPQPLNITRDTFMTELHAIDQRGEVYRGIEAFWAIWQAFPRVSIYAAMATCINLPLVHVAALLMYKGFARIRRFLPKRYDCDGGSCTIHKK